MVRAAEVKAEAQKQIAKAAFEKAVEAEVTRLNWWAARPWRGWFPWRLRLERVS